MRNKIATAIAVLALAVIIHASHNRYQFYDVTLSNGHIQLRGDKLTGKLEQVYIK